MVTEHEPGSSSDHTDESVHSQAGTDDLNDETYEEYAPEVKRRVNALKNIQLKLMDLDVKLYNEIHQLEMRYLKEQIPLYQQRKHIIAGEHEPTDEEAKWVENPDTEEEKDGEGVEKKEVEVDPDKEKEVGVPDFWLTVLKSTSLICDQIEPADEDVLKHLVDIKLVVMDSPMRYKLTFVFTPNEYFTDTELTKTYELKCEWEPNDPFRFEGPDIIKCEGCKINWKKGKNITVKTIKRKQKHRSKNDIRTVTKQVQAESFFNFFDPPEEIDGESEEADTVRSILEQDYEIGHFLKERVIPKAILYFTGDVNDDEEDDGEEEGEFDAEEDSDDESEPAPPGRRGKRSNQASKGAGDGAAVAAAAGNAECKNQ